VKLICADLDGPLPVIPPRAVGAQWVLVRLHGHPIGIVHPPSAGCGPAELRRLAIEQHALAIARHVAGDRLDSPCESESSTLLAQKCPRRRVESRASLTVVVCTRNRAATLRGCLDAIEALDYPADLLEVVIVDNAPTDAATQVLVARYPRMRYVCEPRPGLDWARNCGALAARGEIVAYTDDDVLVDRGWASAIARAFEEEPHAMCVTGLVLPEELDTPAQLLFEQYGGFGRGFDRHVFCVGAGESAALHYGGTGRFGTGANMAFRRTFFEAHGLFDPALDVGTPANGGGDLEMFFRVFKSGYALVYEPAATVRHCHRRTYAELKTQIANNGVGFFTYLMRTAQAYPEERRDIFRLAAWWLWWWNLRRLLHAAINPREFPIDLILAELRGSLSGLRRYAAARRHAAGVLARFGAPTAWRAAG
jgi:glycosyltransferase involved in cell wall biosynthesis